VGEGLAATRVLAATVLVNLGLAGIVGAWVSVLWLRRAESSWATEARCRSWRALRLSLAATAVADGLLLWLQAAYMGEVPLAAALEMLPSMLMTTYVGHAWAGGAVGLSVLVWGVAAGAPERLTSRLAGVAVGVSLFVYWRAAVSHAGDFGLASLQLLVASAHLWATSLWLGAVAVAAFVVLSKTSPATATERADVSGWIQALSAAATGALVVIVGTGLFNAWRAVGSASNLVGSVYGNTLLVKVALVGIAVVLGGLNRFRVMPSLLAALQSSNGSPAQSQHPFVWVLRIEAGVLFAALVAAAVLSSSPLPPATASQQQL
jgi:putative copper resistance protein D